MNVSPLIWVLAIMLQSIAVSAYGSDSEFDTDLLDLQDKENIDLGAFDHAGYLMPGQYKLTVSVNDHPLGERPVNFVEDKPGSSMICMDEDLVRALGLKEKELTTVLAARDKQGCYDYQQLPGVTATGDLGKDALIVMVPQAYRDYVADNWDPPSQWEDGVNGAIFDYSLSFQQTHAKQQAVQNQVTGFGVAGGNVGPWRLRANWQGSYDPASESTLGRGSEKTFDVNRVYAYRALPQQAAKLTLGEQDAGGSVLDSFQFNGVTLASDEQMLPPNLRGYAPEIVGIAKTNAKVEVRQQGRIIYQTQVAAGPFRIQDLSSYVSGMLDVTVQEQDGTAQHFQVNAASLPFLSRPGAVRYRLMVGKAQLQAHDNQGPAFASGEGSWGISNGWSLIGGGLLSEQYALGSLGLGTDLLGLGALTFDVSASRAELKQGTESGKSYRVNYSKTFDDTHSTISFAGYRFSERNFMTMSQYQAARAQPDNADAARQAAKQQYSLSVSQQIPDTRLGIYADYSHQSYWNQPTSERVSLNLSSSFDLGSWRGFNAALTAYRNRQGSMRPDDGLSLNLSMQLGGSDFLSYGSSVNDGRSYHTLTYSGMNDESDSYSLTTGLSDGGNNLSAYFRHAATLADIALAFNHSQTSSAMTLSLDGGMTATAQGVVLHNGNSQGGTRIMVDTDGVADIPLQGGGSNPIYSNRFGKAVLANEPSYYRVSTNIDLDALDHKAAPLGSPVGSDVLTEGAIGYHHFDMLSGEQRMVVIQLANGKPAPFAADVKNSKGQQLGMLADEGMAYLSGLHSGERLSVDWGDNSCRAQLPTLSAGDDVIHLSCA